MEEQKAIIRGEKQMIFLGVALGFVVGFIAGVIVTSMCSMAKLNDRLLEGHYQTKEGADGQ